MPIEAAILKNALYGKVKSFRTNTLTFNVLHVRNNKINDDPYTQYADRLLYPYCMWI